MAGGYERHTRVREEYQRRNPSWVDSVSRYRALVGSAAEPGARILDLGCGRNGLEGADLSCAPEATVVGVDPDSDALGGNRVVTHRVVGSGEDLPFAAASFDIVASAWVLERLDHPGLVFAEIRRVLVDGGRFVFVTSNAWSYHSWIIRANPSLALDGGGEGDVRPIRYRANSSARLHRLFNAAGFARTRLTYNADPPYFACNQPLLAVALAVESLREPRVHILGDARP